MKAVSDAALLVVDDNDDNRYTLTRRLQRQGYSGIDSAENGRIALEMLAAREKRPDVIALDLVMPEMDGWAVLESLRADATFSATPIVVVTILDERERAIGMGASEYLVKPIDHERLLAALTRARAAA